MVSTPTVVGDLLYIGSCAGTFYALDKKTGQLRWSYDIRKDGNQTSFHGDPLVTEELIVIGTDGAGRPDGIGHVYAFERTTGKVRWKYRVGYGISTDILQLGSNVYAATFSDDLFCLDVKSGHANWTFPALVSTNTPLRSSSPAVAADRVFYGRRDGNVYALNAKSGQVIWKRDLGARISPYLTVVGDDLYLGAANGHIYRLNQKNGDVLGYFQAGEELYTKPIVAGNSLLLLFDKTLICLDLSLRNMRWNQKTTGEAHSRPYLWRGMVLVGNELGEVFAFQVTDGTQHWSHKFEGKIRSVGSSGEVLYIGTLNGIVYAYSPGQ